MKNKICYALAVLLCWLFIIAICYIMSHDPLYVNWQPIAPILFILGTILCLGDAYTAVHRSGEYKVRYFLMCLLGHGKKVPSKQ